MHLIGCKIKYKQIKGGCDKKIFETLDITPQDLFMVNYIKPKDVLVDEIIKTVQSISDREKINYIL